MKRWCLIVLLLSAAAAAALLGNHAGMAQTPADPALQEEYDLVVGDQVQIVVQGGREEKETLYTVPANGVVSFPPLGPLKLEGRTTTSIEEEIKKRLKESGRLTDPSVFVIITNYAPRQAFLWGAVTGAVDLPVYKERTLVQILSTMHVDSTTADLKNVKIVRKGRDGTRFPFVVNVDEFFLSNDFRKDLRVMPDDIIYIPSFESVESTSAVYVLGKVARPGKYTFITGREKMTLVTLVAQAGGFTQFAREGAIKLLRKEGNRTSIRVIDFDDIMDGDMQDIELKPDDVIFVPESPL